MISAVNKVLKPLFALSFVCGQGQHYGQGSVLQICPLKVAVPPQLNSPGTF